MKAKNTSSAPKVLVKEARKQGRRDGKNQVPRQEWGVNSVPYLGQLHKKFASFGRELDLEVEQNKKIGALSKGYRQRVGLAQAIIHDPEVLILDEPTSGLDPNQLVEIRELIKRIGKSKTVLLSTHIMQEVSAICDRIIIIKSGAIVADSTPSELQIDEDKQVVYVEFDGEFSKDALKKELGITIIEQVSANAWLIESNNSVDLRLLIAKFAQKNNLLTLTLRKEEKSLEDVFKALTK